MRDISFRGKSKDGLRWVYGSLYKEGSQVFILVGGRFYPEPSNGQSALGIVDWYEVFPDSIGQFTGLHDKNGAEIYEGDIIKRTIHCSYSNDGMAYDVLFQVPVIQELYGNKIEKDDASNSIDLWETSFEVIGNIHDNAELLT